MSTHRFWQLFRALVIISKQIHSCQRMLRELLKHHAVDYSIEDAEVLELTEQINEARERLPVPPEQKQPTKGVN